MAWTQTDLDAIKAAIASGELTVEFRDRRVTYRSMDELFKALEMIQAEVNGGGATRSTYASFTKD